MLALNILTIIRMHTYPDQGFKVPYKLISGLQTNAIKLPIVNIKIVIFSTSFFLYLFDRPNRSTASPICNENTGNIRFEKVVIKFITPYSSVVNIFVYNGNSRKSIILEPIFPIANKIVFKNNVFSLLTDFCFFFTTITSAPHSFLTNNPLNKTNDFLYVLVIYIFFVFPNS